LKYFDTQNTCREKKFFLENFDSYSVLPMIQTLNVLEKAKTEFSEKERKLPQLAANLTAFLYP